jgi:hypothetical protein
MNTNKTSKIIPGVLLFVALALGQPPMPPPNAIPLLTNDSVVKMVKAGLGTELIVSIMTHQAGRYLVDVDSVIALRDAGVPERIVAMMVTHAGRAMNAPPQLPQTPPPFGVGLIGGPVNPSTGGPDENGVYRMGARVGGSMVEPPKVVFVATQPAAVEWAGRGVCGGTFRLSFVVGIDGRAGDFTVLEGTHYVFDQGKISIVDGADAGQVQWQVRQLQGQRYQPGTLDGRPVPIRMDSRGSQICHN